MRFSARYWVAVLALFGAATMPALVHANTWVPLAGISATASLVTNSLCWSDGTDLVCDGSKGLSALSGVSLTSPMSGEGLMFDGINWVNAGAAELLSGTQVAFSVNKGGASQTVTASTWTKLTWSAEEYDTNNNFASNRFTPTVAGYYLIRLQIWCRDSTSFCYAAIYKNGSSFKTLFSAPISTPEAVAPLSAVVYLNGSSDYIEAYGRNDVGTSIGGNTGLTFFQGVLINGMGSGGVGGGGATDLGGLTDVTLSSPASGEVLTYNGSAWVNGAASVNDASKLISDTLEVVANSTGYVSLSTASSTWGYLGNAGSYLPRLNTPMVSATNISATNLTLNGMDVASLLSGTQVAFSVNKGGTAQTLTPSTYTKLTFSTESFDVNSNFDTSTSRFTPTVAGYYLVNLNIGCDDVTDNQACVARIYKNGSAVGNFATRSPGSNTYAFNSVLVYMNGSTDYLEAYAYTQGTLINGAAISSYFQGVLINGMGFGSSGGGSTDLGGLTDVTLSSPASGEVLTYNGSAWVNSAAAGGAGTFATLTDVSVSLAAGNLYGPGSLNGAVDGYTTNTAYGVNSLSSTLLAGSGNSGFGYSALRSIRGGSVNTAAGYQALYSLTSGSNNTAMGGEALYSVTAGSYNAAFGRYAMNKNTNEYNSSFGAQALRYKTSGAYNTAVGYAAGLGVDGATTTAGGTFVGAYAGQGITTGTSNTLLGYNAGGAITTGSNNIVLGAQTTPYSNTGSYQLNIGNAVWGDIGSGLGYANKIGINVASPTAALEVSGTISATSVMVNGVALGSGSSDRIVSGTTSMVAGSGSVTAQSSAAAYLDVSGTTTEMRLGYGRTTNGTAAISLIGDATNTDYGTRLIRNGTGANATSQLESRGNGTLTVRTLNYAPLVLGVSSTSAFTIYPDLSSNFNGYLGVGTTNMGPTYRLYVSGNAYTTGTWGSSDARYKENVRTLGGLLDKVEQLRPVTFTWTKDSPAGKSGDKDEQIGVIAQEVEKVFPDLVKTDKDGYKAVAYDKLGVVLVGAVQELKAENDALKARNAELDARLKALECKTSPAGCR